MAAQATAQTFEIVQNPHLSKYNKTSKSIKDENDASTFTNILLDLKKIEEKDSNSEIVNELIKLPNEKNLENDKLTILKNLSSKKMDTLIDALKNSNTDNQTDESIELSDKLILEDNNYIGEKQISASKLSTLLNTSVEDKEKKLKYKTYISRIFLSKTEHSIKAENEIKQVKTLDEIIKIAKKHELNPQNIQIKTEKTIPKLNIQSQTSINSAKAILESHPHISQHVSALNIKIEEDEKFLDKTPSLSLQKLLQKSNSKKTDNNSQTLILKSSDSEQDEDLTKLFVKLQQNSSKPHQKENIFTSITNIFGDIKSKNQINSKKDKSLFETDINETVRHENIAKPTELINQKIVDAKQTIRHFAQTLQEQVENYKPPFTRMQLTLDPKDLGKVEVTLISRGNNLHIQVNSNPMAIGVMAIQGNELKNQLISMGFTDVQMQFNMNQQQQQQDNRQHIYSAKEYIDIDEIPENYDSLEIIIPQYV